MSLSVTMAKLLQERSELKRLIDEGIETLEMKSREEAILFTEYERNYHLQYLRAVGTVPERTARAKLAVMDLFADLQAARALRRSAEHALRAREHDLETIAAAFHAYNRELKVLDG